MTEFIFRFGDSEKVWAVMESESQLAKEYMDSIDAMKKIPGKCTWDYREVEK